MDRDALYLIAALSLLVTAEAAYLAMLIVTGRRHWWLSQRLPYVGSSVDAAAFTPEEPGLLAGGCGDWPRWSSSVCM